MIEPVKEVGERRRQMTVLVGYIPGVLGDAALQKGVEEARLRASKLVVVNSARGDAPLEPRRLPGDAADELAARLTDSGVDHEIESLVRPREPADEILDAVERHSADLLVIGLRQRSPLGKLLLGSTAQRLLLEARCPVLTVRYS
jgi:nucleotide-binding universal stress UspA family protein